MSRTASSAQTFRTQRACGTLAFSQQITELTPEEQALVMGGNLAHLMKIG